MGKYTTDTTYNLAQQIKFSNKVSNVDYFYGPYDNIDGANAAIEESLRMAGKTVGIIDANGKVEEYWYQPNDSGALELVKKQEDINIESIPESQINTLT